MKKKSSFWLLFLLFLLFSCKSINSNRIELGIPASFVLLSFDDGPNAYGGTTERLLDVLKKHQIRAMFCLLGENAEQYPNIVKRIYDEGHLIVNHGYSDKWAYRMNDEEFTDNLLRGEAAISAALGQELYPKFYRPHGGFYKSRQEEILGEAGYILVPGTIRIYDAQLKRTDKDNAVRKIIRKAERHNGGFILLHDGRNSYLSMERGLDKKPEGFFDRSWIPELVDEVIIILLSKGFNFDINYDYPFE